MNYKKPLVLFLIVASMSSALAMSKLRFFKQETVKDKMDVISTTIKELTPYIVSEKDFVDEKNKKFIQTKLKTLTGEFESLKTHPVMDSLGLSLNQTVMTEELYQTQSLFAANKKSLARAKFTALLNLCVSCHAQIDAKNPSVQTMVYKEQDLSSLKMTDFEKAEMLFISRDYLRAIDIYDQMIIKSKGQEDDELVYQALGRILFYYVKIKQDFKSGKAHFDKIIKAKVLNDSLRDEVKDWSKALGRKTLWDKFDPSKVKEEEMKKFMDTFINDDEEGPFFTVDSSSEVLDLNLSSILLEYYNAHPDTALGGQILYWLGIVDKRLNSELFFSLGDYYLLSCMEKYPTSPVAADCYDSYLQDQEINYLSEDIKVFPEDVQKRLERLKKLINYKDGE